MKIPDCLVEVGIPKIMKPTVETGPKLEVEETKK